MPSVRLPRLTTHKPSPKQLAFLAFNGEEALYGGAAGGGKTDALLMAALQYIDVPNYSAIILRRSYTDLALPGAIMSRARAWLQNANSRWDRETHTFHFPNGATLAFGYIATSDDRYRYQSAEFQYIAFDEVTEFPYEEDYEFMFSRLRRTKELEKAGVPLRVRAASNPVGVGMPWVRNRFVENPNSERIFIPATFMDNEHIDREGYRKSLEKLHPTLQKALIDGDWNVSANAAFPDFDSEVHVVRVQRPPADWRRWEGMDYGTTNPTAWLAAGISPEGDILVHGEYYDTGLVSRHASAILTLRHNYWGEPLLAVADPSIKQATGLQNQFGQPMSVLSAFNEQGIHLVPANNDRMAGFVRLSELLRPDPIRQFPDWHPRAGEFGAPRIYFSEQCVNTIEQLRLAPLSEVDSKDGGETIDPFFESRHGHALAALRYLVTARVFASKQEEFQVAGGRRLNEWNKWNDWRPVG